METSWLWLLLIFLVTIATFIIFLCSSSSKLPPGPLALPIIGHLHLLTDFSHLTLAHFSNKYGPILFLRLGSMPAVVVSSPTIAKEFLQTHDKTFADRPPSEFSQRVAYGRHHAISLAPYGARWKEFRSLCTVGLLNSKILRKLQYIRTEELRLMLQGIYEQSQGGKLAINMAKFLATLTADVVGRMVLSARVSERRVKDGLSLKLIIRKLSAEFTTPVIGDAIPYLGWLDVKVKRTMDELHCLIDAILEDVVAERQQERAGSAMDSPSDFLDVLLSTNVTGGEEAHDKTSTAKGIMLDLLGAGLDTSSSTLEWAMAELLKNPHSLKKLQDEMDTVLQGRSGGMLEESDTSSLPYLSSVIKETFRLHPPAPFLIPHASTEACTVAGYTLPKHTRLFVNVWAMGRDPKIWENPLQFWPERFKDKDIDVRGQHFELLPFGSGRRSCPGMALGLSMVACTLANLVHRFDWELPGGMSAMDLDMREENGVTLCKATPLLAIPKPRLQPTK